MRFVYTWLFLSLGLTMPLFSQTLASWPLDDSNQTQATSVATGLTAADFARGNGISELSISGPGITASNWTTENTSNSVDYYEFCLTANAGQTFNITDVQFTERRSAEGIRAYELYYSTDGFASRTRLDSVGIPDNLSWRTHSANFTRKIQDGEHICFRLYGLAAESDEGEWTIASNSLSVSGSLLNTCFSPFFEGHLSISNIEENSLRLNVAAGSGNARLILMRQGAPVEFTPYQGDNYTSSAAFGAGDQVGPDTYVVGLTGSPIVSFTVTNLIPGVTYFVASYEFNYVNGPCYASTAITASAATSCSDPTPVRQLASSAADARASIAWEAPYCYDDVLVVASESPITGEPTGDGSQYSPDLVYGNGAVHPDFGAGVFPVYLDNATQLTVTGLTNNSLYHFAIFTRLGTKWSHGLSLTAKPVMGCAELNGERLFINEFHYQNIGAEQDIGVELVGPAGTDLSNYELYVYERDNPPASASSVIATRRLSGFIDDEGSGAGAVWVPFPELPVFAGGIVLYNWVSQEVVQYIAYRHASAAQDGPAAGMFAPPIMQENGTLLFEFTFQDGGESMQLVGDGECPSEFTWAILDASPGDLNGTQNVLPVQLLAYWAETKQRAVQLHWQTEAEEDSHYYEIEHSEDGRTFSAIGKTMAAGYSQQQTNYQLQHDKPGLGVNYYRLVQYDFDGSRYDLGVLSVAFNSDRPAEVTMAPNPAQELTRLNWNFPARQLVIVNATGQIIHRQTLSEETRSFQLPIDQLVAGVYWIRLDSGTTIHTQRLLIH